MPGTWLKQTWQYDPTIDAPPKYRRACRYEAFIPDTLAKLEVDLPADVAGVVSDAELAIRRLNDSRAPALGPLAHLLLRSESIASSRIEGLQMGVREVARAEVQADTGVPAGTTAAELIGNINAMEFAVDEAASSAEVGPAEIVAIHRRLMENAPNRRVAGKLRTEQNWIGGNDYNPCGADFVPPPPNEVKRLLKDLCAAINDDRLSPMIQAALVHAQFETIHPFADGNGRAGRALVHVVLRRRGLASQFIPPISIVLANNRTRYINGLTAFRGDEVAKWIEYFAGAAGRAARLAERYVEAVDRRRQEWREQLARSGHAPRAGASAWALIDVLPAHPIITGPVAVEATGRVKMSVYTAIDQLVAAGILVPVSSSKRNRAWEAVGLLSLVERLEEGQLPE